MEITHREFDTYEAAFGFVAGVVDVDDSYVSVINIRALDGRRACVTIAEGELEGSNIDCPHCEAATAACSLCGGRGLVNDTYCFEWYRQQPNLEEPKRDLRYTMTLEIEELGEHDSVFRRSEAELGMNYLNWLDTLCNTDFIKAYLRVIHKKPVIN